MPNLKINSHDGPYTIFVGKPSENFFYVYRIIAALVPGSENSKITITYDTSALQLTKKGGLTIDVQANSQIDINIDKGGANIDYELISSTSKAKSGE